MGHRIGEDKQVFFSKLTIFHLFLLLKNPEHFKIYRSIKADSAINIEFFPSEMVTRDLSAEGHPDGANAIVPKDWYIKKNLSHSI